MIKYMYDDQEYAIMPLEEMVTGRVYKGSCRNAEYAYWTGEHFLHIRYKFNMDYIEEIDHAENEEYHDVFLPFEEVNPCRHEELISRAKDHELRLVMKDTIQ